MSLVLAVALAAPAFVCTRVGVDGPSLAWGPRDVVLQRSGGSEDVSDAEIEAALLFAASQWSAVGCSDVVVSIGAPTDDLVAGFDWAAGTGNEPNHNIVVFRNDTPADPIDAWVHSLGALAITTVTFEGSSGALLDADIEINDVGFAFTACDPGAAGCAVDFDLPNTLVHEVGHVLGLDHSADVAATMFASAPRADTSKRDLADDDEEGLCTIYPAGAAAGECYGVGRQDPPDVRFSPTLCGTGFEPLVVVLLPLLALGQGRRRRRA